MSQTIFDLLTQGSYADDEDVSWKVRRSAAKLLHALIGTRNELLFDFYKGAAPTLIARFSEREESVRLEVLSAFEALLRQTSAARAAELASGGRNKRKRSEEMDDDSATEERLASRRLSVPVYTADILQRDFLPSRRSPPSPPCHSQAARNKVNAHTPGVLRHPTPRRRCTQRRHRFGSKGNLWRRSCRPSLV